MFESFYQLRDQPFSGNPDPRFLYLSATHREAYSSLLYRIQTDSGYLAMIAQPGMGKTTLLFHLLEKLQSCARTAFIFQTQCTSQELLRHLLLEFDCDSSITDSVQISRELKTLLIAEANAGRRCVLVIDEAQNLTADVLETIRLLSDFETPRRKLLQIILSGQIEFGEMLARPELKQLRQRLSCIVSIRRFTPEESVSYIAHRLSIAGYSGSLSALFTSEALLRTIEISEGVPRVINNICFNALSIGCAVKSGRIDASIIEEVARDLSLAWAPSLAQPESQEVSTCQVESYISALAENRRIVAKETIPACIAVCTKQDIDDCSVQALGMQSTDLHYGMLDRETQIEKEPYSGQRIDKRSGINQAAASELPHYEDVNPTEICRQHWRTIDYIRLRGKRLIRKKWSDTSQAIHNIYIARGCVVALIIFTTPAIQLPARYSTTDQHSASFKVRSIPSHTNALTTANPRSVQRVLATGSAFRSGASRNSGHVERGAISKTMNKSLNLVTTMNLATATHNSTGMLSLLTLRPVPADNFVTPALSDSVRQGRDPSNTSTTSNNYVPAKVLKHPSPVYPDYARRAGAAGSTVLLLSIARTGAVEKVRALAGSPLFMASAENAARQWKYMPALSNGRPVESSVVITFQFNPR
ncbi:MAG: TonB family protein [Acidobacteria bacterium]|nr:TonB family protein [Acidobacteriota bacterium]